MNAPQPITDPSLLPPDECWRYRCLNCDLLVQGGWAGVVAHFDVVHPDRPVPTKPTLPAPRERPGRRLTPVKAAERPQTPPVPPAPRTRPPAPQQDALFDLD